MTRQLSQNGVKNAKVEQNDQKVNQKVRPGLQKARQARRYGKVRWRLVSLSMTGILIFLLTLGGILVLPSLLRKPDLFPALCNGNFQSAHVAAIPTPATNTSPDGEPIGLSEGATIFDLNRPDQQEIQYKLQAAQAATTNDSQSVETSLKDAISSDQTDAEAQIYLENWRALGSKHPHITIVVGVNFSSTSKEGSRGTLQGAFTAQKECNDQHRTDSSQTSIVLMIANISGNTHEEQASSATVVADQIADQASKDPSIVAIMGWKLSADSINVNHQLKIRGSTLPMVTPSASSDELEQMSNIFRVCPTNKEQAQIAANFMLKTKQKKRIAILYDNTNAYSNSLQEDFTQFMPEADIVIKSAYTGGYQNDLQAKLTSVLDHNPDAIFFASYSSDLVKLANAISSTRYANLLIVGGDTLANTNNFSPLLPDLHNVHFTAFTSPNAWNRTNPEPPFFQEYKHNFRTLTALNGLPSIDQAVMLGYDALLTLLYASQQVLSTKKTITPSDLETALKQITGANAIQGVTGRIAFDSNGDQDQSKMILVEHIEGTHLVIDERHGCLLKDQCDS